MEPYYQSDLATLYLGDSREVLPTLGKNSVDLLVTDPPYGVKWQSDKRTTKFDLIAGDDGSLDVLSVLEAAIRPLKAKRHVYVFGYTPGQLREAMKLGGTCELIWDKGIIGPGNLTLTWAPSFEKLTFGVSVPSRANRDAGDGNLAARLRQPSVIRVQRPNARGVNKHPTEKPVALMRQLVESSSNLCETVLDPFAGSGSTLVAAISAGRKAVGIEVVEKYAELTAKRLQAAEKLVTELQAV